MESYTAGHGQLKRRQHSDTPRALAIYSAAEGALWTQTVIHTLERTLALPNNGVRLFVDYLHTWLVQEDPGYFDQVRRSYSHTYKKAGIGALLCIGSNATEFALKYGDSLFPHIPVVVLASAAYRHVLQQRPGYTGLLADSRLPGSVRTILSLLPDTKRILFIHDRTPNGLASAACARSIQTDFSSIEFAFVGGPTRVELGNVVRATGRGDAILVLPFSVDGEGAPYPRDQLCQYVSQESPVPVFGGFTLDLNTGVIGGLVNDVEESIEQMGEITSRIARGQSVGDLPPAVHAPVRMVFDYQVLQRFGMTRASLPDKSEVINQPVSFYRQNREVLLVSGGITLSLLSLTTALGICNVLRKRALNSLGESEERYRSLFELAPYPVVVHDGKSIFFANRAATELAGASGPKELIGKSIRDMIDPIDRKLFDQRNKRILEGRQVATELEAGLILPGGDVRRVEAFAAPFPYGNKVAIIDVIHDVTERKTLDDHKRDFYRRTIIAATEGKLVMCDRQEIEEIAGAPLLSYNVRLKEDVSALRHMVADAVRNAGMDESRIADLVLCVGEAVTNAVKHAGGGTATLLRTDDSLLFVVSDNGPGIAAINLPEVALQKGYTTAASLGMGYKAMISLADHIYLATGPDGTTVGIEMKLHGAEKPSLLDNLPDTWGSNQETNSERGDHGE